MFPTTSGLRAVRRTSGALGAVALLALGASPAAAEDGAPALALGDIAPIGGVKPGGSVEIPVAFTDTGTAAAGKVWISYAVTRGLAHTELPSNCLRYEVTSFDEMPSSSVAVCAFDQTVAPGVTYAPEKALTLKASGHALYDRLRVVVSTSDPAPTEGTAEPVRGTGPAVKLVESDAAPTGRADAGHPDWDDAEVAVTAVNTADFRVTGARLKGAAGDTVPLRVRFTNAGPGWVLRKPGTPATRLLITVPAGTTVTKATDLCEKVRARTYDCGTTQAWVDEGGGQIYDFTLRIDRSATDTKGSVALAGASRPFDDDTSDDTADITLDVSGTSSGGSGTSGTTSGSGHSDRPSAAPSASSTGGGAASGGGSSVSGATGSAGVGGDLASTGSGPTLPLAGAAAAAVAVGTGAVLLVRRRTAARR